MKPYSSKVLLGNFVMYHIKIVITFEVDYLMLLLRSFFFICYWKLFQHAQLFLPGMWIFKFFRL